MLRRQQTDASDTVALSPRTNHDLMHRPAVILPQILSLLSWDGYFFF